VEGTRGRGGKRGMWKGCRRNCLMPALLWSRFFFTTKFLEKLERKWKEKFFDAPALVEQVRE
jgi:hypothetical protein